MADTPNLESHFEQALRKHLEATRWVAKIASRQLLEEVEQKGALAAAKNELGPRHLFQKEFDLPGPFSWTMLDRRRPDLTIEAFVLDPLWQQLFTPKELQTARTTITASSKSSIWP